eukprot:CCRYP_012823-RA/>CCRYP_012823-RA protein AED:0.41 eAED:0.62 QI:0/0/0/1/0/0/3/0/283
MSSIGILKGNEGREGIAKSDLKLGCPDYLKHAKRKIVRQLSTQISCVSFTYDAPDMFLGSLSRIQQNFPNVIKNSSMGGKDSVTFISLKTTEMACRMSANDYSAHFDSDHQNCVQFKSQVLGDLFQLLMLYPGHTMDMSGALVNGWLQSFKEMCDRVFRFNEIPSSAVHGILRLCTMHFKNNRFDSAMRLQRAGLNQFYGKASKASRANKKRHGKKEPKSNYKALDPYRDVMMPNKRGRNKTRNTISGKRKVKTCTRNENKTVRKRGGHALKAMNGKIFFPIW